MQGSEQFSIESRLFKTHLNGQSSAQTPQAKPTPDQNPPQDIGNLLTQKVTNYSAPPLEELKIDFRTWHVEALLNQAADLIERCVQQLQQYRSLDYASAQDKLNISVQEKELELDNARREDLKRDIVIVEKRLQFFSADPNHHFNESRRHADELYNTAYERRTRGDALRDAQNINEKNLEHVAREIDRDLTGLQKTWAERDATYKQSLLNIRVDTMQRRIALSSPGQPLALDWQRNLLAERLHRDYQGALKRASVAEVGLRDIYGKTWEESSAPPNDVRTPDEAITHVAKWIQDSITYLAAYQQRDQAFTRVVSTRAFYKETWKEVRSTTEPLGIPLDIPGDLFAGHENVRLRGVSCSLVGKVGTVPWSIEVRVPRKAVYVRSGRRERCDQDDIPACLLGRVENRTSFRPPEVCGIISLMNASPIGRMPDEDASRDKRLWWIKVSRPDSPLESYGNLDDVLLEISAVGLPKVGG